MERIPKATYRAVVVRNAAFSDGYLWEVVETGCLTRIKGAVIGFVAFVAVEIGAR